MAKLKSGTRIYGSLIVDSTITGAGVTLTGIITATSINATTSTITNETGTNLNFSGVGTISTLNSTVGTITNLGGTNVNYSGVGTIATFNATTSTITNENGTNLNFSGLSTATTLRGTNINYSGIGTIATFNATTSTITNENGTNLNFSGVGTVGSLNIGATQVISSTRQLQNITSLDVSGVGTVGSLYIGLTQVIGSLRQLQNITSLDVSGVGTITNLGGTNINYSGIGTIATFNATTSTITNENGTNLNFSGLSTATTLRGTNINYSGIATIGTIQIGSGIVTATSGVVTYYGDGSKLTGVSGGTSLSISTTTSSAFNYITVVSSSSTSVLGISTVSAPLVFIPSTGNLGVGTTNPGTSKLHVQGNERLTGSLFLNSSSQVQIEGSGGTYGDTSIEFVGGVPGITGNGAINYYIRSGASSYNQITFTGSNFSPASSTLDLGTTSSRWNIGYFNAVNVTGSGTSTSQLFVTGVSTLGTLRVTSGIVTATSGVVTYYGDGSKLTGISASSDGTAFNTGITSALSLTLTGIGTTALTLPSTAGKQYLIYSINAANVSTANTELNVIAAFDFNGGERSYFAYNIPIPTGTSVELLKQPQVLNPSDRITMRSTDYNRVGINTFVQVHISYQEKTTSDYFGVGLGTVGIAVTDLTTVYTSSTYPSIVQSIRLTNRTDSGAYPVSVSITSGVTTINLIDNLIVPKYASVEILDTQKRLNLNDILKIQVDQTSTIDIQVSGKKITS